MQFLIFKYTSIFFLKKAQADVVLGMVLGMGVGKGEIENK